MSPTETSRPLGGNRPATTATTRVSPTVPHRSDPTRVPRWTDADVALAWECGFQYACGPAWALRAAEAVDDARAAVIMPPRLPHEARVQLRIAAMELDANVAMQRLAEQAERNRAHDRQVLALAGVTP